MRFTEPTHPKINDGISEGRFFNAACAPTYTQLSLDTQRTGTFETTVCSISTSIWETLKNLQGTGRILGHFQRAIDIFVNDTHDNTIIALVTPEVGNGPFNIVVDALPPTAQPQDIDIVWNKNTLHVGSWKLYTSTAPVLWNPRPSWEKLRPQASQLRRLHRIAIKAMHNRETPSPVVHLLLGNKIPEVTALQQAFVAGNRQTITDAVSHLAGWGPGLTPSGDDFLAGVMMATQICKSQIANRKSVLFASLPQWIFEAAVPRTTQLSRAFLSASSHGLADERWHKLLHALTTDDTKALDRAAKAALNFGASSGLDTVTGFLWMLEFTSHKS